MKEISIINHNFGVKKILFLTPWDQLLKNNNIEIIAKYNKIDLHSININNPLFISIYNYKKHIENYEKGHYHKYYKLIKEYIFKNKIKYILVLSNGAPYHENFIKELQKNGCIITCYFGDDPEGSELMSKPYVKNYDYAFCGGIYYDSNKTIAEKYIEWGAKKSEFIPLGLYNGKYLDREPKYDEKNIDLLYVGGLYFPKVFKMFKLKKHFGDRMHFYGRGWNRSNIWWKTIILKIIKKIYGIGDIKELKNEDFINIYQRTKIGFNLHMSYGPSNLRTYELSGNGILQITDCEEGTSQLFEKGKEIIFYKNIDEAIEKIEYYLKNDKERIKIAKAGYKKTIEYYKVEESFKRIFDLFF